MTTRLPISPDLLNLGSQAHLIELFPMAAYAVRAPDGVIAWFNSRAAKLWAVCPHLMIRMNVFAERTNFIMPMVRGWPIAILLSPWR
jgi:hypothetical protein